MFLVDIDILWLDMDILWLDIAILRLDINMLWPDIDILRPDINIIMPDIDILRLDIDILRLDINILWLDINILWPDIDILWLDINILRLDWRATEWQLALASVFVLLTTSHISHFCTLSICISLHCLSMRIGGILCKNTLFLSKVGHICCIFCAVFAYFHVSG